MRNELVYIRVVRPMPGNILSFCCIEPEWVVWTSQASVICRDVIKMESLLDIRQQLFATWDHFGILFLRSGTWGSKKWVISIKVCKVKVCATLWFVTVMEGFSHHNIQNNSCENWNYK